MGVVCTFKARPQASTGWPVGSIVYSDSALAFYSFASSFKSFKRLVNIEQRRNKEFSYYVSTYAGHSSHIALLSSVLTPTLLTGQGTCM